MRLDLARPTLRPLCAALTLVATLACTPSEAAQGEATESSSASETTVSESASTESETTEAATESETTEGEGETETETGEECTGIPCDSTLTLNFAHSLPLEEGPHRFTVNTPTHEVLCSVSPTPEGAESCFGFMFSDLTWNTELVTLVLTRPFFDTDIDPEATPFESVMLTVERGQEELFAAEIPIEGGDPIQPDPCGPVCWEAQGSVTVE